MQSEMKARPAIHLSDADNAALWGMVQSRCCHSAAPYDPSMAAQIADGRSVVVYVSVISDAVVRYINELASCRDRVLVYSWNPRLFAVACDGGNVYCRHIREILH